MTRWLRLACYLAGGIPDVIPLEDAVAIAEVAVARKLVPPAYKWVDDGEDDNSLAYAGVC